MQEVPVNVFWDIENCAVPSNMKGVHVVNAIRQFALQRGILKNISAFANFKLLKERLRADMQESGVLLHDIVTSKPNSSDLVILVEILKVVIDNKPPHCIILISGDRDFANVISTLAFRKYKIVLIYSPQASSVLRNAASEAVSWNDLLKRGGGKPCPMPLEVPLIPQNHFNDKFQPLMKILNSFGGYQVKWTDLGNIVPYDKLGYPKLSYYLFDAEDAGLVKCGTTNNMPWVTVVNGPTTAQLGPANTQMPPLLSITKKMPIIPCLSPAYRATSPIHLQAPSSSIITQTTPTVTSPTSPSLGNGIPLVPSFTSAYRTPPPDRNLVVNHLISVLESLKKDYFKPTETTIQKRMKELNVPLPPSLDWEDIVDIAKTHYFAVEGEKPNRVIFPPGGSFEGADPNHPRDNYPNAWWKAMQQFFAEVHPVSHSGRYGFAVYLKEKGPQEVREMSLGAITEMVQMALDRQLLMYNKKKSMVCTIGNTPNDQNHQSIPQNALASAPDSMALRSSTGSDDAHSEGEEARDCLVGVTFSWPYRAKHGQITSVLVTGSFFNWRNTIALHRNENSHNTNNNNNNNHTHDSSPNIINSALSPRAHSQDYNEHHNNNARNNFNSNNNNNNFSNTHHGSTGGMNEPEDIFSTVLYLPPGLYEYKFIVDGIWHHDPRQSVVTDKAGNVNNIVDVKPSSPATLREYV